MKKSAAERHPTRKRPSQTRSLEKFEKILEATRALLVESEGAASANLTTKLIADRSGIAVGSLYQYFPNVESVLFEIHRGFADRARVTLSEFDSAEHLMKARNLFFDDLYRTLTAGLGEHQDILLALRTEAQVYPSLAELEQEQAEFTAIQFVKFFKYYGSKWPDDKLKRLGLFIYYADWGTWMYRDYAKPDSEEARDWGRDIFRTMTDRCFTEA